jgi:hypothetical protein
MPLRCVESKYKFEIGAQTTQLAKDISVGAALAKMSLFFPKVCSGEVYFKPSMY